MKSKCKKRLVLEWIESGLDVLKVRISQELTVQNYFRENDGQVYVTSTFRWLWEEAGRRLLGLVEELLVTFAPPSYTGTCIHTHMHLLDPKFLWG